MVETTTHDLAKARNASAALSTFLEALQAASSKRDAHLIALNAVIRTHGVPTVSFGAPPNIPVGTMVLHRAELLVVGLHRHIMSELTHGCMGVESLVVPSSTASRLCCDEAERTTLARSEWAAADGPAPTRAGDPASSPPGRVAVKLLTA